MESGDNMFIFSELTYDRVGGYLGHGDPFTLYRSLYGSYRGVPSALDGLVSGRMSLFQPPDCSAH